MSIPIEYLINDSRTSKHFQKQSFSGYMKKDVSTELNKKIIARELEPACNWCIELILSLETSKLYERFILIACKYINIQNPCLPIKLYNRYFFYKKNKINDINARNSQIVRNHLIELCSIITLSTKGKPLSIINIKDSEFDIGFIMSKFTAKKNHITHLTKSNDSQEIKIILNEFADCLIEKNYNNSVYWLSWLIHYEKNLNKKKKKIICHERNLNVDQKYRQDIIWFIWSIIIDISQKLHPKAYEQIIHLYKLYTYDYKATIKHKHISYILFSLKYFTFNYNIHQPLCLEYKLVVKSVSLVNYMFIEKKKHENMNHFNSNNVMIVDTVVKNKNPTKPVKNISVKVKKKEKEEKSLDKFFILQSIDTKRYLK